MPSVSTIIQRNWRGVLARRKAEKKRAALLQRLQLCLKATIRIQTWCRALLAKWLRLRLLCRWFTREFTRFRSSIWIQCFWGSQLALKHLQRLKFESEDLEKLWCASVSRISVVHRRRLFRNAIQKWVDRTQNFRIRHL